MFIVSFAATIAIWPREVVSCRDFILRAVTTFRAMSLVRIYPGRAFLLLALFWCQRAKKVVSNSPGLVDFAIGLLKSVFNLPDGQVMFFEEFK